MTYPLAPTTENFASCTQLCGRRSAWPARVRAIASAGEKAIGRPRLADVESGFAGRLLGFDLHVVDPGAARAAAAPVDHRPDSLLVAFEHRFDAPVGRVADPARQAERLSPRSGVGTEEDPLYASVNPDMVACHPENPSSPTSGTNRHGTEWTTAGPSGLRTITSSRWARGPPTGTTSRPPGRSCSYSVSGSPGAAAATAMASNGARSGTPSVPSPTRTSTRS